ncbi:ubiquinol-cytochrome C reductase hinge domain-containing protein [Lipomyces arxii]|uniref:ubiquinol-cytochrome C reductase hinge domain-containing protein n=1 Tax=Lipomyces arxii TaxID=56418 RepID=UPI0034CFF1B9
MLAALTEFFEAIVPVVKAEEPEEEVEAVEEEASAEEESEPEAEEAEEEEEEEEDPEDTFPAIREECAETKICHPFKHHFDECVERVTKASEEEGYEDLEYKEDCIEEFFHLSHCVNDCAAPKLFATLK